jgi:hypothetical protein
MALMITTMPMISGDIESGIMEMNPWFKEGITDDDYVLAKELGILDNPKDLDDFDKMICEEEEFNDERQAFEDELDRLDAGYIATCECMIPNHTYENIDVRVIKKFSNWALGSIDGNKCVYIPKSLINKVSYGELVSMTLVYTGLNPNPWKAIHASKKIDPVEMGEIMNINDTECMKMKTFHIPKQDIGKMVGKNGNNISRIMKDYLYNNPNDSCLFSDESYDGTNEWFQNATDIPKFNITNQEEYTAVNMWYNSVLDNMYIHFDPVKDLLQKMYA